MAVESHPSFASPSSTSLMWRYIDLPKFTSLLISRELWLTNAETLALDDPHEASLSTAQFGHRKWLRPEDVPPNLLKQIAAQFGPKAAASPIEAFNNYMKMQEQIHLDAQFGRKRYFMNCWHSAQGESVAMWKIYASPGPGLAIVSNSAKISESLRNNDQICYLGHVRYFDEEREEVDFSNGFNMVLSKRKSFSFEKEVRLVHWDTTNSRSPVDFDSWSEKILRFERLFPNEWPATPGLSLNCDVGTLIERVVISPYAPKWYVGIIEGLRDKFGFQFPVEVSKLMQAPQAN